MTIPEISAVGECDPHKCSRYAVVCQIRYTTAYMLTALFDEEGS